MVLGGRSNSGTEPSEAGKVGGKETSTSPKAKARGKRVMGGVERRMREKQRTRSSERAEWCYVYAVLLSKVEAWK